MEARVSLEEARRIRWAGSVMLALRLVMRVSFHQTMSPTQIWASVGESTTCPHACTEVSVNQHKLHQGQGRTRAARGYAHERGDAGQVVDGHEGLRHDGQQLQSIKNEFCLRQARVHDREVLEEEEDRHN